MMKLLPALFAAACLTLVAASDGRASAPETIVFRHVSVLPMDRETVLADQMVVVRAGVIERIGPEDGRPAPRGARQIDGRGRFLIPGLVDFHAHSNAREELLSYLLHGQTTVVTMGGEGLHRPPMRDLPAPNVMSASDTLDGFPPTNRRFYALTADTAGAVIDEQLAQGADFLKVYSRMKEPALGAVLAEAQRKGVAVAGHVPQGAPLPALFARGFDMVAHGEEFFPALGPTPDAAKFDEVAALTARYRVAVTPNLVAYAWMARHAVNLPAELPRPEVAFLSPATYQEWLPSNNRYATRPEPAAFAERTRASLVILKTLTRTLNDHGVLLLAGTDAPILCTPGDCLIEELQLLSDAGLGPYGALRAATANAGRFSTETLRRPYRFGVIAPGTRADLVLLDSNPLKGFATLNRPVGVMVSGRWRTAGELGAVRERLRAEIGRRHALVDRYEALLAAGGGEPLLRFLDREIAPRSDVLNVNVVIFDALILENDGHRDQAIALLQHVLPSFVWPRGVHNVLARMLADSGDREGAARAFRAALALRPHDAIALDGLSKLAAGA